MSHRGMRQQDLLCRSRRHVDRCRSSSYSRRGRARNRQCEGQEVVHRDLSSWLNEVVPLVMSLHLDLEDRMGRKSRVADLEVSRSGRVVRHGGVLGFRALMRVLKVGCGRT
jgi:hypothetical protein